MIRGRSVGDRFIDDWRKELNRVWSMKFIIAAVLFEAADQVLPLFVDFIPKGPFAVLSMIAAVGAGAARLVKQS